jgi:hypothetical protein
MRMLMNVKMPTREFNATLKDGSAVQKMRHILEEIQPEAAYFTELDGQRTAILIVNINESSEVPRLAEPWFLNFNAIVEIKIAMTQEDLQKADIDELCKRWS